MGNLFCCYQVHYPKFAIKTTFGSHPVALHSGCHCVPWICGQKIAGKLTFLVQRLDVRFEAKTQDNHFVNVVASIQYQHNNNRLCDAFYNLRNIRAQMESSVSDAIRIIVEQSSVDDVVRPNAQIVEAVKARLEADLPYCVIVGEPIVVIEHDERVKRAINETNAALRIATAAESRAQKENELKLHLAKGEADAKEWSGKGIARHQKEIADGLKASFLGTSDNGALATIAKDFKDMITATQYFDTMKKIGASTNASTVFIPYGPGVMRDIAP